jgi:hypothetical protein
MPLICRYAFHLDHTNTPQADPSYLPSNLNYVTSVKFLGLDIDSSFTWRQHIKTLLPKLGKAFYALLVLSKSLDNQVLRQVYFAYFHSPISYGLIFWGNSSDALRVFLAQKIASDCYRVLAPGSIANTSRNKILPLPSMFIFQCFLFVKSNPVFFYQK